MKKTFTLTLTLFILSYAAFSQPVFTQVSFRTPAVSINYGRYTSPRYVENYTYSKYERDMQLARINTAYNQQVKEAMNLRINASKKIDLIQQLQRERDNKIQSVINRFSDARNKYNDYYYDRDFNRIRW
jgi:hypothetical protein